MVRDAQWEGVSRKTASLCSSRRLSLKDYSGLIFLRRGVVSSYVGQRDGEETGGVERRREVPAQRAGLSLSGLSQVRKQSLWCGTEENCRGKKEAGRPCSGQAKQPLVVPGVVILTPCLLRLCVFVTVFLLETW